MLAMLLIYKWTILAGAVAAPALALLGAQLATRDRAMQTMCVGQGAMVGVLLGLGIVHQWDYEALDALGPFVTAMVFSALTYIVTDKLVATRSASKNTTFAFVFSLLLAAGYLLSSLFPRLETHMAQIYFGDLATLAVLDSQITFVGGLVCLVCLALYSKAISNQSFEWAIFGGPLALGKPDWKIGAFKLISLVTLCFSVQFVGFLFTIAMLFLPTALMNFTATKGLRLHCWLCTIVATVGTVVGFSLSLQFTRLPTVPAIVAVMFILSILVVGVERSLFGLLKETRAVKQKEWSRGLAAEA